VPPPPTGPPANPGVAISAKHAKTIAQRVSGITCSNLNFYFRQSDDYIPHKVDSTKAIFRTYRVRPFPSPPGSRVGDENTEQVVDAKIRTLIRSRSTNMITSMAYILLLVLPGALGTVSAKPQSGSAGAKFADILTKGSWAHVTRVGPPNHSIALESSTLTFCACGHVRETIGDDTGIHESYGNWALEPTDHGDVLILAGELRYRGRFSIKYLEKEQAIDLWFDAPERALRWQSVKTYDDPCTSSNLMDRTSMPVVDLADVLTKGSWEYEAKAGTPDQSVARERRTLTLCPCGHVRERFINESTTANLYGKWALERNSDGDVLVLSGGYLVDRGRFFIKYLEKEQAIELWAGSSERALRFQSVKTEENPCRRPK